MVPLLKIIDNLLSSCVSKRNFRTFGCCVPSYVDDLHCGLYVAEDCGLEGRQKLSRFTAYCADQIVAEVESRAGYKLGDWEVFEVALKKYYFKCDSTQCEYQMPFLRTLAERQTNGRYDDIPIYCG